MDCTDNEIIGILAVDDDGSCCGGSDGAGVPWQHFYHIFDVGPLSSQ